MLWFQATRAAGPPSSRRTTPASPPGRAASTASRERERPEAAPGPAPGPDNPAESAWDRLAAGEARPAHRHRATLPAYDQAVQPKRQQQGRDDAPGDGRLAIRRTHTASFLVRVSGSAPPSGRNGPGGRATESASGWRSPPRAGSRTHHRSRPSTGCSRLRLVAVVGLPRFLRTRTKSLPLGVRAASFIVSPSLWTVTNRFRSLTCLLRRGRRHLERTGHDGAVALGRAEGVQREGIQGTARDEQTGTRRDESPQPPGHGTPPFRDPVETGRTIAGRPRRDKTNRAVGGGWWNEVPASPAP